MVADPEFWKLPLATECRGLVFDSSGNCISRSFQKFFNLNETDETQYNVVKGKAIRQVADKRDGSLITPVLVGGNIYWKSKKSFYSDVAVDAAKNVPNELIPFVLSYLLDDKTPIYEYTSPQNRVVIDYGENQSSFY